MLLLGLMLGIMAGAAITDGLNTIDIKNHGKVAMWDQVYTCKPVAKDRCGRCGDEEDK